MPRFRPSGEPAKPVVPTKTHQQISRLCPTEWGSGCWDRGGIAHRCIKAKRHNPPHECECSEEA